MVIALPVEVQDALIVLNDSGYDAFVAGGCVRDTLIGRTPNDWDIATNASPAEVIHSFEKDGWKCIETGLKHGTVTVHNNHSGWLDTKLEKYPRASFEVTSFRKDVKCDGRHAEVVFVDSMLEDAKRRDFTMNALYADVEGNVYDPTGRGLKDFESGCIYFVGNPADRIHEDHLRILRLFRFAAQLGMQVCGKAFEACVENYPLLKDVSKERIWAEYSKILATDNWFDVCKTLREMDASSPVLYVANLKDKERKDLDNISARLASVSLIDGTSLQARLKIDNITRDEVDWLLTDCGILSTYGNWAWALHMCPERDYLFRDLLILWDVPHRNSVIQKAKAPQLDISGDHVMSHLGIKEGPQVGKYIRIAKRIHFESNGFLGLREILEILES